MINPNSRHFSSRRVCWAWILGACGLITAWACHYAAYSAGYHVRPEISLLCGNAKNGVLLLLAVIIIVIALKQRGLRRRFFTLIPILMLASPWAVPQFRKDIGWHAFIARVESEFRPDELSKWLKELSSGRYAGSAVHRLLTRDEFARFGQSGGAMPLPWVSISAEKAMIGWGTDLQIWAICLQENELCEYPWQDDLCFRTFEK